jgi:hypothetical protein
MQARDRVGRLNPTRTMEKVALAGHALHAVYEKRGDRRAGHPPVGHLRAGCDDPPVPVFDDLDRRSLINDQFQQGVVWVSEVDTHAPTTSTTANDRPLLYLDLMAAKVSQDLLDGAGPHETQVAASRHNRWPRHQRADVETRSVHIELLIAEPVGDTTVRVVNNVGSQDISIEGRGPFPVANRDHAVVEFDFHLRHG